MEKEKNQNVEKGVIRMVKLLDAPVAQVWEALTNKDKMKKWYFDVPDFKPEIGNEFSFEGGEEGKKPFVHRCRIVELVPGKKIAYTWRYEGYEGVSTLSFELFEEGNKTKLILLHSGLDTFPANNSSFAITNFVGGWTHFMEKGLPAFLTSAQ